VLRPRLVPYAFIAPNLVLFTTFVFLPMVYALYISFHRWNVIGEPAFIGVANYTRLATDPLFWQALRNTVVYSLGTVPASLALGLLLAVALNRRMVGRVVLRSLFFLPVVISSVVAAIIARGCSTTTTVSSTWCSSASASSRSPGSRRPPGRCRP
jgi:multiple sugar transport system permease protein